MRSLTVALAATLLLALFAAPRAAQAAPGGSYRNSCRNMRVYGAILTADCRSGWGWRTSQIDYKRCYGDIANENGYLVCQGDRGPYPPYGRPYHEGGYNDGDYPGGGEGYGGLVLFGGYGFSGPAFPTQGDVSNLGGSGFNDRAESVRINGGVWLVCEHANYGGRCITLDRSVADLSRFGMSGQISSVRRLR